MMGLDSIDRGGLLVTLIGSATFRDSALGADVLLSGSEHLDVWYTVFLVGLRYTVKPKFAIELL